MKIDDSRILKKLGYTAISRKKPSRPMGFLQEKGLLKGEMLDYGCGRGTDAKYFGMDAYDPFWMPEKPNKQYDTITCHFVLNVVEHDIQQKILEHIKHLLKVGGIAYISVRRDMKKEYSVNEYTQHLVYLDLPTIEINSGYEIYKMEK